MWKSIKSIFSATKKVGSHVKDGIKRTRNTRKFEAMMNPKNTVNRVKRKLKSVAIKSAIILLLCTFPILIVVEATKTITKKIKAFGDVLTTPFTALADEWSGTISEDDIKQVLDETDIHPQKISQYIEVENQSYPSSSVDRKIKVTKTVNGNKSIYERDYTLDLSSISGQFKIPWQLLLVTDQINDSAKDITNTKIIDNAEKYLIPELKWGYNKYFKEVTTYEKRWYKEYVDGKLVKSTSNNPRTTKIVKRIPLPYLISAKSAFKEYSYSYKEDVLVKNTGWSVINKSTREWEETIELPIEIPIEGENENINTETEPKKIEKHRKVTYVQTKEKIIQDIPSDTIETRNEDGFLKYVSAIGLSNSDLQLIYDMLIEIPETEHICYSIYQLLENENTFIGYNEPINIDLSMFEDIPLFLQWDNRWGAVPYGYKGTIASSGCGPTSLSMVLTGLSANYNKYDLNKDSILDPIEVTKFSVDNGYRVSAGTSWGLFPDLGRKSGLNVNVYQSNEFSRMYNKLRKGQVVIASMSPGHFTRGGHFIVLVGLDEKGRIKVNDPASKQRSNIAWNPSIIALEAVQYWSFENPNK